MRVETVMAGGLWRAFVDPGQLENAILNLVINARDAMTVPPAWLSASKACVPR